MIVISVSTVALENVKIDTPYGLVGPHDSSLVRVIRR